MDKIKMMKDLVAELNAASDAYYNGKEPLMSDTEFDRKIKELTELEKETNVLLSNSPTINVGAPVLSGIKTVNMEQKPMLSLDKVHSYKEVVDFANRKGLVSSVKCDGMSTRLIYMDGDFISANSRGNGIEGSDITEHVKHFMNIPLKINKPGTYVVDGESIIKDDDFKIVNDKLPKKAKLKNSRNAVSGTLASLDVSVVEDRRVSFILWDVIEGCDCNDFQGRLCEAESLGFEVVPHEYFENVSESAVEERINKMFEESKQNGIPNDGVVFRLSDIKYGDSLGHTSHHFNNAIAYKPENECCETTLIDIEYKMGKTGSLCPTAVFEPVELSGSTVERASLHNISIMKSLELSYGDTITVYKANMIIPQIGENVTRSLTDICVPPDKCPICGAPTAIKKDNDTEVLYCTSDSCLGKMLGKLINFVGKKGMDIDGLSEATLGVLLDKGFIHSYVDIFHLESHQADLSGLPGFGARSVSKLLKSINDSRKVDLPHLLTSLSIPLLGESTCKDISKYCKGDVNAFISVMSKGASEFSSIDGVGAAAVSSLDDWWKGNSDEFFPLLEELDIQVPTTSEKNTDLSRKTFVITGSLNHFSNRDELKKVLVDCGGKVSGSVSKNTYALICNDTSSNTGKLKKAKDLGVSIWTEEDILKIMN